MGNRGRPKKYKDPTTFSFKIEKDLKKIVRRKAEKNGDNLSDLINSFLKTYANVNSDLDELKEKVEKAKKDEEEAKMRKKALEKELEKAKEEAELYLEPKDEQYLKHHINDLEGERTQIKRIRNMAARYDVDPREFLERVKEQVDGFDGLSGESALEMGG